MTKIHFGLNLKEAIDTSSRIFFCPIILRPCLVDAQSSEFVGATRLVTRGFLTRIMCFVGDGTVLKSE
ncbi:MAG TPA: hypothetical protein DEP84_11365 [Chloroflexi bacterium]|nr:hypothetical protein [Chloroflexota bacterium]